MKIQTSPFHIQKALYYDLRPILPFLAPFTTTVAFVAGVDQDHAQNMQPDLDPMVHSCEAVQTKKGMKVQLVGLYFYGYLYDVILCNISFLPTVQST